MLSKLKSSRLAIVSTILIALAAITATASGGTGLAFLDSVTSYLGLTTTSTTAPELKGEPTPTPMLEYGTVPPQEKKDEETKVDDPVKGGGGVTLDIASSSLYTFATTTSGSFTDMTGSTMLAAPAADTDDASSAVTNLGFDFFLMGNRYTQFSASSNGMVGLGGTAVGSGTYTVSSGTTTTPIISAFGGDLRTGSSGKVHYKLTGSAPNRVLTIEFTNMSLLYVATPGSNDGTYQVKLFESTGEIDFVYGGMTRNSGTTALNSQQVGIGFATNTSATNFLNIISATNSSNTAGSFAQQTYSTGAIANLNTPTDGSRRVYSLTPAVPAAPTGLSFTSVGSTGMTLNWTDNATNEAAYAIYRSTDGGTTYSYFGASAENASTFAATGLSASTTYFWKVYAVSEGALSTALSGSQATTAPATITSAATGNWTATATWVGGVVPTSADNVVIADGHTVTINTSPTVNALTVGQGTSGTLIFDTTARAMVVSNNVTVAAGGTFITQAATTATHTLAIGGDLANAGTFDMSRGGTTLICNVTFNKNGNQTISGAGGTTRFNLITLNMGTTNANVLDVASSNFAAATAFATLTNGTLKMSGSYTFSNTFFSGSGYTIGSTGGIWLNNANVTVTAQGGSPTMSGLLRMTAGIYNVGTSSGNAMGGASTSSFIIEGGTMNFGSRLNVTSSGASFNMSGGTINVCTIASPCNASTTTASFGFTSATSVFTMSGGTINLVQASTGATPYDYFVNTTSPTITGGTLNIGTAATATNFNFRIFGALPNVVVDNTTNNKTATVINGTTSAYGTTTVNSGATLNLNGFTYTERAATFTNNGTLTGTTASSRLSFFSATVAAQTFAGSGTVTAPLDGISVQNGGLTITHTNVFQTLRANLFAGAITNSNKITLGSGAASAVTVQIGAAASTQVGGSFDVAPTFNLGTGTYTLLYLQESAARTTGLEIPATRSVSSVQINNTNNVTLSGGALSLTGTTALTLTAGNLVTSSSNLPTITTTTAASLSGGSSTSYVKGPLARTLAASQVTGSTFTFPIGKTGFNPFELINPTTGTGGTLVIQAEAFDANSGGTAGTGLTSINTNRYWQTSSSGAGSLTNTAVKITDSPLTNRIGQSTTQGGTYNSIGGTSSANSFSGTGLLSNTITSLGFFVYGTQSLPSGTYTVGAGGAYTTLTAALADYNSLSLTGPVVFSLTDTAYASETFPLTCNLNAGASSTNTLTIKPASGIAAVISGSNTTSIFDLNGCNYAIIDGLNTGGSSLKIRNTSTSGSAIRFINDASNNIVQNSTIESPITTSTSGVILFSTGTTTGNRSNTLTANTIRDRSDTTGVPANLIYSAGSSATIVNKSNTISNNTLQDFTGIGMTMTSTGNDTWTISGNTIAETVARSTGLTGISFNSAGTNTITQNTIRDLNTSSTVTGILLANAFGTTVSRNRIYSIPSTSGSTSTLQGVRYTGGSGLSTSVTFVNNQISIIPSFTNAQTVTGIEDDGFTGNVFNAYFNTVLIGGTASGSATWAYARRTSTPTTTTLTDNIFFNNRTGGSVNHFAAGDESANTGTWSSNYNIFVGTGTTAANFMDYGTSSSGTAVSSATWSTGPPTRDANSLFSNPTGSYTVAGMFTSTSDLHLVNVATNPAMNVGNLTGTGVSNDFDNDSRPLNTGPEIGADEVQTYTITSSAGSNGTIAPNGTTTISSGSSQGYTITPNTLYNVQDVLVDGASVGAVTTYTFPNVTANHTISATFALASVATTTGLTSSVNPSFTDQQVTFTATVLTSPGGAPVATGTVTIYEGTTCSGTTLGTGTPNASGQVAAVVNSFSAGSHSIKACYTAGAGFTDSVSGTLTQTVNKHDQTITVTPGAFANQDRYFGNYSWTLPTASSGLQIEITSDTPAKCTVGDPHVSTVTFVTLGTCTIRVSQAGNANYNAAPDVTRTFTIFASPTTTTVTSSANPAVYGTANTLTATVRLNANSSVAPTAGNIKFIEGGSCASPTTVLQADTAINGSGVVTFPTSSLGVASHTITACYSGGGTNVVDSSGQITQDITTADQATLTVDDPGTVIYGTTPQLKTSGGSGTGAVTFSHGSSTGCTVTSGGVLTVTDASASCSVTATKVADANYNSATSAARTITLAKASSSTVITCPVSVVYTGSAQTPCSAAVTGAGGLSTTATVNYTNNTIVGTATADATYAGDTNHTGSTATQKTFAITKATTTTTVTFEASPYTYRGTAFTATASVTGDGLQGFTASVSVVYSGDCTNVTTTNGCTATATYAGDNYHDGSTDSKSITITTANQTHLVISAPVTITYGAANTYIVYTGGSGTGAVSYSQGTSDGCTVDSNTGLVTVTNASGTCQAQVSKAADPNYNFDVSAFFAITMVKADQTIAFGALGDKNIGDADFVVSATGGGSGNPVTFASLTAPVCTTSGSNGSLVHIVTTGLCTIRASQAGGLNHNAASNVDQSFTINNVTYAITASSGAHGSVTPDGATNVPYGTDQAYAITPDTNYVIADVLVDGSSVGAVSTYTFTNVTTTHTISATFALADVVFNANGNLTGGTYNNITVNGPAVVTVTGNVVVNGCVNVNNGGTLIMGGYVFTGPGCFTLASGGTLGIGSADGITSSGATGSVQTTGTRTFDSGASYVYNGTGNQAVGNGLPGTVANLTINNTGTIPDARVTGNAGQIVVGLLYVANGIYESHSDYNDVTIDNGATLTLTGATTVSGNWTNNGGTLTGNYGVTFDGGTGQTITGNTTFYDFTKSVTGAQQMKFAAGSTTTVSHALTFTGAAGNLLSLRSTSTPSQWNLIAPSSTNATYVDVQDSNNTGTTITASNSTDSGNNIGWSFTPTTATVTFDANGGTGTMAPQTRNYNDSAALTANTFTRTGYTFVDWATNSSGSGTHYADGATYGFTASVTLYAQWSINQYTVTYNGNGNTGGTAPVDANSPYNYGSTVTVLGNTGGLTKTGYTFAGWNTIADGSGTSYAPAITFTIVGNNTLYAQWTINSYTLTYTAGAHGSLSGNQSQSVNYGGSGTPVTALPDSQYHFVDWSDGSTANPRTETNVTANLSVTANFAINTYTVTYSGNGNTGGTPPVDANSPYNSGTLVTVLGNTGGLTRTGYAFIGWNTIADGSGSAYTPGVQFTIVSDNTLYAQWTPTYTVTYNGNGNTGGTAPVDANSPYNSGATVTVLGNTGGLTKTGYTFAGWNTVADGSGTSYAPAITFPIVGNNTLYAQWTINSYSVVYDGNGYTGGTAPATQSGPYNTSVTLAGVGSLVKTGYTFAGWNTAANGSGTAYSPGASFTIPASNTTLYAQWTINTYTITVTQTAGGTIAPDTTVVNHGASQTFTITPDAGFYIESLVVDGVSQTIATSYTFNNVTANHTITATYTSCVNVSTPTMTTPSTPTGYPVTIPVNASDLTGRGVISAQFTFTYDPAVVSSTPANITVTPGTVLPSGEHVDFNANTPGTILVSIYGTNAFTGAGTLVNINMKAIGSVGSVSPLTISSLLLNGGLVCANVSSGTLTVVSTPTATTVTSSLNPSTYGDNVTFTATVAPVPTGGTVDFTIDGNIVATGVAVDGSGQATYSTASLNVTNSPHSVSASYSGFPPFTASSGALSGGQTINKAASSTVITCPASVVYNGSAQTPCSATVTGAGGLLTTVPVVYGNNTNVGTATADASYPGDANHTASVATQVTFAITRATTTTTVTFESGPYVYRGTPFTATATVTGIGTQSFTASVPVVYSGDCTHVTTTNGCTATATYPDDANHTGSSDSKSITITQASSSTVVTCPTSVVYTGSAQTPCTVSVTGVGGLNLTPAANYSNNTNVGTATASYTFAGDTDHTGSSDSKNFDISQATTTTTVTFEPGPYVYRGTPFTATATVTGVGSQSFTSSISVTYSGDCTHVTTTNGCTATASYPGDVNHTGSSDTKSITITQATSSTVITCPTSVVYNGSAQTPCSAAVTGAGGLNTTATVVYANNTNVGTATADASYAGDTDHSGSTATQVTFAITRATTTTTVTFEPGPYVYRGTPFTATASVTGVGTQSFTASVPVVYSGDCTHVTTTNGCTATATYPDDANHTGSSDSKSITITQAASSTVITCPTSVVYNGSAQTPCSAAVTGAGGLNTTATVVYANNTNVGTATADASYAGDTDHSSSTATQVTFAITRATTTTTVTFEPGPYVYRGTPFTATASVTGVGTQSFTASVPVVYSGDCTHVTSTNGCSATATYAGDANHFGSSDTKSITITQAASTTTIDCSPGSFTYTGSALTPCTATVTGAGGLNTTAAVIYGNNTNVGTATADASYAGDTDHSGSTATQVTFAITKATTTTTVTFEPGPYVYRGTPFTATATVTGVGSQSFTSSISVTYSGDCTHVTTTNGCTATASYPGDVNHTGSSDTKSITITQATSSTVITCPTSVVYNGSAQTPCSAAVTGAGGLNTTATVVYANNTNVGTATADASYAGDTDHSGSTATQVTFAITRATTTTTVTFEPGPYVYRGTPFTATASVTGVGTQSFTASVPVVYSGDCTNVTTTNGCTATATYADDANHTGSSDIKSITITKRPATWTTDPASKTFGDADPNPLTTGSGDFLTVDGVTSTYSRVAGETASPPTYHITATLSATGSLNNYTITNDGAEFTINTRTLSGTVTYVNAATPGVPVPYTTITATGPSPLPTPAVTSLSGAYSMSGFGAGSYTFTPTKAPYLTNQNNGIFADDAAKISQHVVGLITLSNNQIEAGRVSGLPTLTSFDAALIAQYIVGIPNALNQSGNWKFNPASPSMVVGVGSVQNYNGILMGDVNGDWVPETSRPTHVPDPDNSVRISVPHTESRQGTVVNVPMRIDNLRGENVGSYQFDIEYDPAVLEPTAAAASINGTLSNGLGVVSNAPQPGLLKVVVYGAVPVGGDGVYVDLHFNTIGAAGSTSPLNIWNFRLNDGRSDIYPVNGIVTIAAENGAALHGRLLSATGQPVGKARVNITDTTGRSVTVLSSPFGYFGISGLTVGGTYTVTVDSKRYTFSPRTVSVTDNVTDLELISDQ